jgi:hypothetical protein
MFWGDMLQIGNIIKMDAGKPYVVTSINDCAAACVELNGRKWDDSSVVISLRERKVRIGTKSDCKVWGQFAGTIEQPKVIDIITDRSLPREYVMIPRYGFAPKKLKRVPVEELKIDMITDDDEESELMRLLKTAAEYMAAMLSGV